MNSKKWVLSLRIFSTIVFPIIIMGLLILTGYSLEHAKTITPEDNTFVVDKEGISILNFDPLDEGTNTKVEIIELSNPDLHAFMVEEYVDNTLVSTYRVNVYGSSLNMDLDLVTKVSDTRVGYIYYQTAGTITFEYTTIFGEVPRDSQLFISYQPNLYDISFVLLTMLFGSIILYIINYKQVQVFGFQKHKKQFKELSTIEKIGLVMLSFFIPFLGSILFVNGAMDIKNKRCISIGNYAVIGFMLNFLTIFSIIVSKILNIF